MEVTLLGTGNPMPDPHRAGAATLVRAGGLTLLVDAGRGVTMRLASAGSFPPQLSAVLLTHLHSDHICDLNDVVTTRWVMSMGDPGPFRIIGPPGTAGVVAGMQAMLEPDVRYRLAHHPDMHHPPALDVVEALPGVVLDEGGVRVIAAATDHRPVEPTLGYRIEHGGVVVALGGDSVPCAGLDELCAGADIYVQTVLRDDLDPRRRYPAAPRHDRLPLDGGPRRGDGGPRRCRHPGAHPPGPVPRQRQRRGVASHRRRALQRRHRGRRGPVGDPRLMVEKSSAGTSYTETIAAVTAPGERFETTRVDIAGVEHTVFVNGPPSLRELFALCRDRRDATFLVDDDPVTGTTDRWTFGRFMDEVDGLAAALVGELGVQPGDRVAIAMRNRPEWIVGFAATVSIGAISVSLNGWWTADELDFALEDSAPRVLLADPERAERAAPSCERLGINLVCTDPWAGVTDWDATDRDATEWASVVVPAAPMPEVSVHPDDDATILYTSGTTGRPKGAVSTHRSILQALLGFGCRTAVARLRSPDDARTAAAQPPVFILIVPLFHVTGCVAVMLSCVANGLTLVIMRKWDAGRALELIERESVTNFVGVPTQAWDLLEHPRFADYDTSSLVSVGGGGAPAPPELVRRVEAGFRRGRPSIGYGMTETNAYGPQNSGDDYLAHPTSTGRATPILEIAVRDPDGHDLPVGERGEIWFKGPHLIRGYWNRPDATAEVIVDGWLRSGDLGRIDDEGFVYVEDRAKDMVLRGGENVYCAEVEAAIYEHPGVHEAAVFGLPHERLGEEVAAAVVARSGQVIDPDEVRAFLAPRLAGFKVPSRWIVLDEPLPRNAAGKFLKRELRDQVLAAES